MSKSFSERYSYTKPSSFIIKGKITNKVLNALSSCFTQLKEDLDDVDYQNSLDNGDDDWQDIYRKSFNQMDRNVWTEFMNRRADQYFGGLRMRDFDAVQQCLNNPKLEWYRKLDCVEFAIAFMRREFTDRARKEVVDNFIKNVNRQFERLNYGYRIVQGEIVDIVSDIVIQTVDEAAEQNDSVGFHLKEALKLYSLKPTPDCRNSIKESITAVETLLRTLTDENTFGKAFDKVKKQQTIHPRLEEMIQKMYDYSNQKDTGIRHAKVELYDRYLPSTEEALFLLVTCSATVNYVKRKLSNNKH